MRVRFFLKEFWYFTIKSLLLVWDVSEITLTQKAADLPYLSPHVSMLQTWEWEHILVLEWAHLSWILPNMARIEKDWNQKNKQNITRKSRGERDWVLARPKITWSYCWCLFPVQSESISGSYSHDIVHLQAVEKQQSNLRHQFTYRTIWACAALFEENG